MRVIGSKALLLTCALLAGCATLPEVDTAHLSQLRGSHPGGSLPLLRSEGEQLAKTPFVPGNLVDLLVDGPTTYRAMFEAIRNARSRIDMECYIFDKEVGGGIAAFLLAARARGVEVNLVYDAWGSKDTPAALFERLRHGGVRVLEFNPLHPSDRVPLDLNRRDHRKLLVVDNATVITGGVNISGVYLNPTAPPGDRPADPDDRHWRDTDIRIQGPVAPRFSELFRQTWNDQHGAPLTPPPPPPTSRPGDALVQAIGGDPHREQPMIYRTLLAAITLAQHSVHLTTGFFVPTPQLARVLEQASRRGVEVTIVVPSHSTSGMAIEAGRSYYGALLAAGVHIFERHGAVLHAKTAVIDGAWSAVGSSNLDWRSVLFNEEIDAVVLDRRFGAQMEALFRFDLAHSARLDPDEWSRRGLGERVEEWGARAFEYLL